MIKVIFHRFFLFLLAAFHAISSLGQTKNEQQQMNAFINGMESNRYRVLVGNDAKLMDYFYRLNPKSAASMICKQMQALLTG
jgi:hypothetical protein